MKPFKIKQISIETYKEGHITASALGYVASVSYTIAVEIVITDTLKRL
jgi:hypothetical protein